VNECKPLLVGRHGPGDMVNVEEFIESFHGRDLHSSTLGLNLSRF